jgi:hypothetical protein
MRRAREYGEMECLPFQTFGDVLSDSLQRRSNILMNPINAFFNKTEEIFTPLKQVYSTVLLSNLLMTELKTWPNPKSMGFLRELEVLKVFLKDLQGILYCVCVSDCQLAEDIAWGDLGVGLQRVKFREPMGRERLKMR